MSVHLQREIDRLKRHLLSVCGMVEEQVQVAVRALIDRDDVAAQQVVQQDLDIDHREVEVEEDCLKVLALYQPVATDLRFIVAALKINNDLERIGDMAVNIARKAITLASQPPIDIPGDLESMSGKSQAMLRDSIDSMVNADARLAKDVCKRDDEVDGLKREIRLKVQEMMRNEPARVEAFLCVLAASRNLERIADLATNIAEDVIYMIEGRIIRHGAT